MINKDKTYFISDLHLKLDKSEKTKQMKEKLLKFLCSLPDDTKEIVLLGDIFDFWYEWLHVIPAYHFDIFYRLRIMIDNGVKITYLAGNHDFYLGDYLKNEIGINCISNEYEFESGGKKFFISHGDGLAASDRGYRLLKKILRARMSNLLFRTFIPPDLGIYIAKITSGSSRRYRNVDRIKWKGEYLAYAECKMKEGYDFVIFGHLHYPEIIETDNGIYLNTGDWMKHFSYGVFDGIKLKLERYHEE
ncbi:MAG: UDP-2,3-diacylglucosamine diphosphatase [Candidatus Delongbacteria bacterium]|nr:UDP-2,3-diacylglucosamine diphosphatase [Candidatus Delongbacteria bacterium]